jgi:hypothetical protein
MREGIAGQESAPIRGRCWIICALSSVLATSQTSLSCRRDKARQLFSDGLQMALPEVPGGDVAFASAEVECAMHAASGGVNKEYTKKSRRLSFNIRDPNNPDLRRRVLAGDVTGKQTALWKSTS